MKYIIAIFSIVFVQFLSGAQTADSSVAIITTPDCYTEYKAMFAKRGVYALKDGLHKGFITFRLNGITSCYDAQIRIEDGKFKKFYIKNDQGEFVTVRSTGRDFNPNYDAYRLPIENKVVNGMSPTYITNKDELADVFITDILKPETK